ncbi:MAG: DUF882 domain-containing protein [Thermodesulfovibrionales bacterium]|nr:DUF882 domain-containing protein [Thermodesulfovibrionales bacterium]
MISRRKFLKTVTAGIALCSFGDFPAFAYQDNQKRTLNMYNIHTGEELNVSYCISGRYDQDALENINYFLRCHHTNEVKEIDVGVIDLLCDIKDAMDTDHQIQIISGYRSPDYNEVLLSQGKGVAKNSLHLSGLAIDFSLEGISPCDIFQLAKSFSAGGVGQYPEFVHIDVGKVRYW